MVQRIPRGKCHSRRQRQPGMRLRNSDDRLDHRGALPQEHPQLQRLAEEYLARRSVGNRLPDAVVRERPTVMNALGPPEAYALRHWRRPSAHAASTRATARADASCTQRLLPVSPEQRPGQSPNQVTRTGQGERRQGGDRRAVLIEKPIIGATLRPRRGGTLPASIPGQFSTMVSFRRAPTPLGAGSGKEFRCQT